MQNVTCWPKTSTGDVCSHVSDRVTNGHVADSAIRVAIDPKGDIQPASKVSTDQFRQGRLDTRVRIGACPNCENIRQMLKGESALFLNLVKHPENHLRVAHIMPLRMEMWIRKV
jgi:hypothetical protein